MLTGTGQSRMWKGDQQELYALGLELANFCQNWWSKEIHLISATDHRPVVMVSLSPNGFPIAITCCPTCSLDELPIPVQLRNYL
jgi:hypothetical protein